MRKLTRTGAVAAIAAAGVDLISASGMPSAIVESLNDVAGAMVNDLLDCPDAALALDGDAQDALAVAAIVAAISLAFRP